MQRGKKGWLFDHPVGVDEQHRRDRESELVKRNLVGRVALLVQRIEDAPAHWLQVVAHVGQRARRTGAAPAHGSRGVAKV
jgi:hypothetical protein